jgi:hypothetical protein
VKFPIRTNAPFILITKYEWGISPYGKFHWEYFDE